VPLGQLEQRGVEGATPVWWRLWTPASTWATDPVGMSRDATASAGRTSSAEDQSGGEFDRPHVIPPFREQAAAMMISPTMQSSHRRRRCRIR
jgi:hypothetical protein